uniref:Uncharacterized protein n=1 Tax=Glossina pallidipes TaxID=7398 RepID=A0A1B0AJT3_GLOPL
MLPCCGWACKGKGEGIPLKQHHHQFLVGTQFGAGRQQHKYENHTERTALCKSSQAIYGILRAGNGPYGGSVIIGVATLGLHQVKCITSVSTLNHRDGLLHIDDIIRVNTCLESERSYKQNLLYIHLKATSIIEAEYVLNMCLAGNDDP